ncbi:SDR family NAD(P)-dependent oxidoreductase [Lactobacillus sp. ESL0731]|uniref:SDR family NAD(P)-dependent oxidoreductase n=1 Tax=unclassified Lactobacillus TaxID=2620435 RepID=UPI0023F79A81|nr:MULTISPECIES: SDR family NAD(P)-dependent oxidoreductase [unclassified Lactobacillus]WEV51572.1 SDR family NAD(P)-dependent oxidoreductase [Lactobacillus sp. ESL0700]WEV62701.1 SDR family NAD(P)-dependent oxidoreductase [Lactobacillus sp. ESL0731]
MKKFDGKVILVTGAANGIGKGIAEKFAQNGANTVIVDFDEKKGQAVADELTSKYQKSLFVKTDVSDYSALENVHAKVMETFGRIDSLVIDAGIAYADTVDEISVEEWQRVININLSGAFYTVKAFYQEFLENKGSMVFITSGSALSGTGGGVAYPASKAGDEGLMRGLAKELGPKGVTINAIAPRVIDSGLLSVHYPTKESLKPLLQQIAVRRIGKVDDVANLAYFLASPENSYIQGQTILLDGNRTVR